MMLHEVRVEDEANASGRWLSVGLWLVQIGLAGFFLMGGVSKLLGAADMVALFEAVGVGQWLRLVTGGLEVFGAVLLLLPGRSLLGALVLALVLVGAVASHVLLIGDGPFFPLSLGVFVAVVLLGRRGQWTRLGLGERATSDRRQG